VQTPPSRASNLWVLLRRPVGGAPTCDPR
jgi:hypothetical protein